MYSNDTALASHGFGIFLLQRHPEPNFDTCNEDSYYFMATPWFRLALIFGFLSSGLSHPSDQA